MTAPRVSEEIIKDASTYLHKNGFDGEADAVMELLSERAALEARLAEKTDMLSVAMLSSNISELRAAAQKHLDKARREAIEAGMAKATEFLMDVMNKARKAFARSLLADFKCYEGAGTGAEFLLGALRREAGEEGE